jgi:hypothetical protein
VPYTGGVVPVLFGWPFYTISNFIRLAVLFGLHVTLVEVLESRFGSQSTRSCELLSTSCWPH